MQEYARILNYAIPFFIILIAIEYSVSCYQRKNVNRLFDTISSLSSGVTNVIKDVLGLTVVIISYEWMVSKVAFFEIRSELLLYILAFIGIDFAGYWVHRWSHEINLFWNRHIIHHSSEEFNLSCALRQSVSEIFALFTFTYLPMAFIGIPIQVIAVVAPIHLFAQFWYHTRLIGSMGILEHIIVTPSHHRVHHAINSLYMDKNYGQIFIVWDKLFGTFQPEIVNEMPVYGVSRAVNTWNPWIINYQHLWLLISDAWRTNNFIDKIKIWFMPTGWRPKDVADKYPVSYTTNVHDRPKYETSSSLLFKIWSASQLVITLLLMMHLFNQIGNLKFIEILLYGVLLFISVFAYTSLMDGSILGLIGEAAKMLLALYLFWSNGFEWFGLHLIIPPGNFLVIGYFFMSFLISIYFYYFEKPSPVFVAEMNAVLT